MKLLVINGPNLNMLGVREQDIYGKQTLQDLETLVQSHASLKGIHCDFFQSNHEGALVDSIQGALHRYDGLILNPAAYTHTSIAILDALKAVQLPTVEVHLSDIEKREDFRRHSYVSAACIATITGRHFQGYLDAVDALHYHMMKHTP